MSVEVNTIIDADVGGVLTDVRIEGPDVAAIGTALSRRGTRVIDARGGALLPGLHDHHIHLLAMAARSDSIDVGEATDPAEFDTLVRDAHRTRHDADWLRVVGVDDRHGALDAARLDRLVPDRPVRLQHRSGAAWMLNTEASRRATRDAGVWLHRSDDELRRSWATESPPDLSAVSRALAAVGITGVTDATPFASAGGFEALASARGRGELAQRVMVTGGPDLATAPTPSGLTRGPVKLVVGDHELPSPDDLATGITTAHNAGRPVALHCVTRVALVVALVAWDIAGAAPGDRIEHGSVIPVELIPKLADLGLQVVTQPGFIRARGDAYLTDVDADDRPHLYRCGSLIDAGVGVGMSTDAPYGPADPWVAIATATDRRTVAGRVVGDNEAIPTARALDGFLTMPDAPGGAPRRIAPGSPADLCLLDSPLHVVLETPSSESVIATWISGVLVHGIP